MPNMRHLNSLVGLLLILLSIAAYRSADAADAPADDTAKYGRKLNNEERLAALDMLANAMRENYEKIQNCSLEYYFIQRDRRLEDLPRNITWAAPGTPPSLNRGEIKTGKDAGAGYWLYKRGRFRMCLDQANPRYHLRHTTSEPAGFIDVVNGTEGWLSKAGSLIQWIVNSDYAWHWDRNEQHRTFPSRTDLPQIPGQWQSRMVHRDSATKIMKLGLHMAHPLGFFKTRNAATPGEFCASYSRGLRGEFGEESRNRLNDSIVLYANQELPPTYTVVRSNADTGKNRCIVSIYDGKNGFNLNKHSYISEDSRSQTTITYRNVAGVFIPQTYEEERDEETGGKLLPQWLYSYELLNAELNADIPDAEFDIQQFEFQYGDRMIDEDEKKFYVYDDQVGFVPAEQFQFDPSRVVKDDK